jgi:aldo/keto reductase family protein
MLAGEPVDATPVRFVSLTEEVPGPVIDVAIHGLVCRSEGSIGEVGRPTAQDAVQPCSYFIPAAFVAWHQQFADLRLDPLHTLLGRARPQVPAASRGFLTGQIKTVDDLAPDDYRRNTPRFQGENFQKNLDLVRESEAMAQEKGCMPAQLALAWALARGDDIVPIPGTKRRRYLEENVGALEIRLSAGDLARIDQVLPPGMASGTRYAAPQMQALSR